MSATMKRFMTDYALVDYFSKQIATALETAIAERGQGYLVVSGGRTPVPLFQRLASMPLAWDKVTITLADDRWVNSDHDASNEKLVREHLLQGQAAAANFISLVTTAADAADGVEAVNQRLAELPTFDVVILGMGEDGHTASLFPCSAEIEAGLTTTAPALAVTPTTAPHQRMSLSKSRLLNSRQLYLQLSGASKANVLSQAQQETDPKVMPISAFLRQADVPMEVLLASV